MNVSYSVEYRKDAFSYLRRLSPKWRDRIVEAIETLAEDPDASELDVKKLTGRPAHRLRVGKYRVIFERHEEKLLIVVILIRGRGDVYKR